MKAIEMGKRVPQSGNVGQSGISQRSPVLKDLIKLRCLLYFAPNIKWLKLDVISTKRLSNDEASLPLG
jgi:hypothetical protein